ncbi:hypothetical protein [Streptomyces alboflavus]|uniref:hypothetical protein n=1 Tax=Streptomyces alboflavus TaxID=67267 RepID=UPI000F656DA4|nr:hypothetical protein [Streptomyces alboflavus]
MTGRPERSVDVPRTPGGAGGWDARSAELAAATDGAAWGGVPDEAAPGALAVGTGVPGEVAPGGPPTPVQGPVYIPVPDPAPTPAQSLAPTPGPDQPQAPAPTPVQDPAPAAAPPGPPTPATPRRGPADPVKALMHRHRDLCERAVDPLEIAAGLEAHGLTDRTAARFRHRDVFALAEEMYARVPQDSAEWDALADDTHAARADTRAQVPPGWAVFALLPGAACALAVAGLGLVDGRPRLAVVLGGALAVAAAAGIALRYGPLRAALPATRATHTWVCWLLAYALLGDGLLRAAVSGGPDGPWAPSAAAALVLAGAVAPGTWCARLFAVRAGGRLGASRGLAEFAASVRPLLIVVFALYLGAVGALITGVRTLPVPGPGTALSAAGAGALAALLWLGRMLRAHGSRRAPALVYATVGASQVAAVALLFAGRLPGCGFLAAPVEGLVDAAGAGALAALTCATGAVVLLARAVRVLGRASAHAVAEGAR